MYIIEQLITDLNAPDPYNPGRRWEPVKDEPSFKYYGFAMNRCNDYKKYINGTFRVRRVTPIKECIA